MTEFCQGFEYTSSDPSFTLYTSSTPTYSHFAHHHGTAGLPTDKLSTHTCNSHYHRMSETPSLRRANSFMWPEFHFHSSVRINGASSIHMYIRHSRKGDDKQLSATISERATRPRITHLLTHYLQWLAQSICKGICLLSCSCTSLVPITTSW